MADPAPSTQLLFEVELLFALTDQLHRRWVKVLPGCTVAQAIHAAGLMTAWHGGEGSLPRPLACHGRLITPDTVLSAGDRVEILGPLLADPKNQRRQRVNAKNKASARALSAPKIR